MGQEGITCFFNRRKKLNNLYEKISNLKPDTEEYNNEIKKISLQLSMIRLAQSGDRLWITAISVITGSVLWALILKLLNFA